MTPGGAAQRSERDVQILRSLSARIDPRDAGAQNNLGVVYYRKGLLLEAIDAFERALAIDPRMEVAERNLRIAYSHEGFYGRLVADLEATLAREPDDLATRTRLAQAYERAGDAASARPHWEALRERARSDPTATLAVARADAERGELKSALAAIDAGAAAGLADPRLQLQAGELLYQLARPEEARARLEGALDLDETIAAAHHMLAFVYGDLGLADEATAAAARAEELNPAYGRAEANLSLDSYSSARYEELLGEHGAGPGLAEGSLAHYNLGVALRERGLHAEAQREFGLAETHGEDPLLVHQAQAELLLLRGEGAEALPLFDAAIEIEPESPKLWNERGVAAHQSGDLEAAERSYRRALELDPGYVLARNNLAVARVHADDPAEADRIFAEALESSAAPADAWRNHALAMARTGRHEAASRAYRAAIERDPDAATSWAGLGTTLLALARYEDARASLVQAVQLDPELAEARYQLAFALSALGDYQGALRETRLALELDPLFPAPRFRLLIDVQFEETGVPAPDMGGERRLAPDAAVEEFRFESEALADVFASLERGDGPDESVEAEAPVADGGVDADAPDAHVEALLARTLDAASAAPPAENGSDTDPLTAARRALERADLHAAHAAARRAAEAGAARSQVLLIRAEAFLRQGFAGEALERFEAVLSEESEDALDAAVRAEAELGCSRALLELGRTREALSTAAALAGATGDARALRAQGRALAADQRPAEAAEVLERALEVAEEGRAAIALDAGQACLASGRGAEAERLFRVALSLEPDSPAGLTGLGRALASLGHDDAAGDALSAALVALPTYADAALSLAALRRRGGDPDAAVATLAEFLLADPYHFGALQRLGEYLAHDGRAEDAAVAFRRILAFDPGDDRARDALRSLEAERVDAGAA
ncbi:MAG TPA: tetratricopeptide repeat protein [Longimicrobiales bacterium]|nr:tetratricopeptide repeat protein [Longimicrobiales bacterium]